MGIRWKSAVLYSAAAVACTTVHAFGGAGDHHFRDGIEAAKQATVGILDESRRAGPSDGAARFALRASGFFIGDGYFVTAHHAVERDEPGKKGIPDRSE